MRQLWPVHAQYVRTRSHVERGRNSCRPRLDVTIDQAVAVALEEAVVKVAILDSIEDVVGKVVKDEEVDGREFPEHGFITVIEARVFQRLKLKRWVKLEIVVEVC
jgi:hypothetical protein